MDGRPNISPAHGSLSGVSSRRRTSWHPALWRVASSSVSVWRRSAAHSGIPRRVVLLLSVLRRRLSSAIRRVWVLVTITLIVAPLIRVPVVIILITISVIIIIVIVVVLWRPVILRRRPSTTALVVPGTALVWRLTAVASLVCHVGRV